MSNLEFNLPSILQIEDDERVLDFRCAKTGYLLWPLIRIQLIRFILSDLLYGQSLIQMAPSRAGAQAVKTLGKAIAYNFTRGHGLKSKVMLMGTGLGLYLENNRWFNRLTDHFVSAYPGTTTVEDFFGWRWPFPRHNQRVIFHAPIQTYATLAGRCMIRKTHLHTAAELVALLRVRSRQALDWELGDERAAYLTNMLARHAAAIPAKRGAYQRLLSRAGTRLLIKEEGCYGPSSVLLATAKEMGVVTAEYQHGSISAGNDAYNLAPAIIRSDVYRKTLPEYFLGYGEWWNEQINTPVKKLVIGNPHRSEQLKNLPAGSEKKCDILILGDGIDTRFYLDFARRLARKRLLGMHVVFRPHPMERELVERENVGDSNQLVRVDCNPDIYQSFSTAHAVVSEVSTGLFEAVGLADRIFMLNTSKSRFCYPEHPFEIIADVDEIVERLHAPASGGVIFSEKIWAPHWQRNYLEFLTLVQNVHGVPLNME